MKDAITRTYDSWRGMRRRCRNPSCKEYDNYGKRGIKVCKKWDESFQDFLDDMGTRGEGLELHRIDPYGDYEPGNCVWCPQTIHRRLAKRPRSGKVKIILGEELLYGKVDMQFGKDGGRIK